MDEMPCICFFFFCLFCPIAGRAPFEMGLVVIRTKLDGTLTKWYIDSGQRNRIQLHWCRIVGRVHAYHKEWVYK